MAGGRGCGQVGVRRTRAAGVDQRGTTRPPATGEDTADSPLVQFADHSHIDAQFLTAALDGHARRRDGDTKCRHRFDCRTGGISARGCGQRGVHPGPGRGAGSGDGFDFFGQLVSPDAGHQLVGGNDLGVGSEPGRGPAERWGQFVGSDPSGLGQAVDGRHRSVHDPRIPGEGVEIVEGHGRFDAGLPARQGMNVAGRAHHDAARPERPGSGGP